MVIITNMYGVYVVAWLQFEFLILISPVNHALSMKPQLLENAVHVISALDLCVSHVIKIWQLITDSINTAGPGVCHFTVFCLRFLDLYILQRDTTHSSTKPYQFGVSCLSSTGGERTSLKQENAGRTQRNKGLLSVNVIYPSLVRGICFK